METAERGRNCHDRHPNEGPRPSRRLREDRGDRTSGLSVTAAAAVLGVTRAALSALLNERADLSPEMAIRIEKAFGVSMETLMRMQNSFDIAEARKRVSEIKVEPYKAKTTATANNPVRKF